MNIKSQIQSAYVAGLCPLELLMRHGPDSYRNSLPAPACDQAPADLPRTPSRRKRALLLILTVGLAIGAWQLFSRADERQAAEVSATLRSAARA